MTFVRWLMLVVVTASASMAAAKLRRRRRVRRNVRTEITTELSQRGGLNRSAAEIRNMLKYNVFNAGYGEAPPDGPR
jgi:hypothetical protein